MYVVVFHPKVLDDLSPSFHKVSIKTLLRRTEKRLSAHPLPDGRVIKRLHHIVTAVFFEYKIRSDWRAIFYIDHGHEEVRVMGYIPKNLGARLFDRKLELLFSTRYGSAFEAYA